MTFFKKIPHWAKLTSLIVVLILSILGSTASITSYFCANKVMPRTYVSGVNIGGDSFVQAEQVIKDNQSQLNNQKITIAYKDDKKNFSLSDLSVNITSDNITTRVIRKHDTFEWVRYSYWDEFFKDKKLTFDYTVDDEALKNKIYDSFQLPAKPENASLKTENNQISVVSEKIGQAIDLATVKDAISTLLVTNSTNVVDLVTQESYPTVRDENANETKAKIESSLQPIKLQNSDFSYTISAADQIGWLDFKTQEDKLTWEVNKSKISSYVTGVIAKKFNKGMAQKVTIQDTGEVTNQGSEGRALKSDELTNSIYQTATEQNNNNSLPIPYNTVAITEKIIGPGYIAGLFPGKYIDVNLSKQMLYLMNGTNKEAEYQVSTGKWSTPTPIGTYSIGNKDPRAYSSSFGLYMPWWNGFIGREYGIHELPEWPSGYKEGEGHLGTPVSHGCIRLGVGPAKLVYDWADIGTPVNIHRD